MIEKQDGFNFFPIAFHFAATYISESTPQLVWILGLFLGISSVAFYALVKQKIAMGNFQWESV